MATITEFFGSATAFTNTNLVSMTASATAGWQSNAIDNSSNLYDDALVMLELGSAAHGTAATNTVFIFAFALINTAASLFTTQGGGNTGPTGTEATITLPNVTSAPVNLPLLGTGTALGTVASILGPFSVARAFGGILPPKWGICIINNTAATFASATARYIEVKYTVA